MEDAHRTVLKSGLLGVNRKHHPRRNLGLTITKVGRRCAFKVANLFAIFFVVTIHKGTFGKMIPYGIAMKN